MCFNCLFYDELVQVIYIPSFSFNLNFVEAESIIWKQSRVLRLLQSWFSFKSLKNMWLFAFLQMYCDACWQMASCLTSITDITACTLKFVNNKGLQKFGNVIFNTKWITNIKRCKNSLYWEIFRILITNFLQFLLCSF